MKFTNQYSNDVLEVPPPDQIGRSVIRFNGKIVERVTYSDLDGGSVTTEDGRVFHGAEWPEYLLEQLRLGAWNVIN